MATRIKIRKDTTANWYLHNPVLALGEPGLETKVFSNRNVKSCIPFLDSLTSGYMLLTTQDIHLEFKDNNYIITPSTSEVKEVVID